MSNKDIKYNGSGYYDPTAYTAIKNMQKDADSEARVKRFINTVLYIADLAGLKIENRMEIRDRKTGKVWR